MGGADEDVSGGGRGWEEIHGRGLDGNKLRVTDRKDKRG